MEEVPANMTTDGAALTKVLVAPKNALLENPTYFLEFKKWVVVGFEYFSSKVMKHETSELYKISMYALCLVAGFYLFMAVVMITYCTTGKALYLYPYGSRENSALTSLIIAALMLSKFVFTFFVFHDTIFVDKSPAAVTRYVPAFALGTFSYFVFLAVVLGVEAYFISKVERRSLDKHFLMKYLFLVLPEAILMQLCTILPTKLSLADFSGPLFNLEILVRCVGTLVILSVHAPQIVKKVEKAKDLSKKKRKRIREQDDSSLGPRKRREDDDSSSELRLPAKDAVTVDLGMDGKPVKSKGKEGAIDIV